MKRAESRARALRALVRWGNEGLSSGWPIDGIWQDKPGYREVAADLERVLRELEKLAGNESGEGNVSRIH